MNLKDYDNQIVRIITNEDIIFEGRCYFNNKDFTNYLVDEYIESLDIDNWIFYQDDIKSVEIIEEKDTYIWLNKTEHLMKLHSKPFKLIEDGLKTIELRLYDEKRQKINIGDIIRFENIDDQEVIHMEVIDLYIFNNFEELYKNLNLLECGYNQEELSKANYQDMEDYYPLDKQKEYKVVGIRIKEID